MKALFSRKEFEYVQQKYNRMYFELYKKYYKEKTKVKKAQSKIEAMFVNGNDDVLDDLIELYDILIEKEN